MRIIKKVLSLSLTLCMLLTLCGFIPGNVAYASDDIADIKNEIINVNGYDVSVTLYVDGDVTFTAGSDYIIDKAQLSVTVYYKDSAGKTYTKDYGSQTFSITYNAVYEMPSSFYDILNNYQVYKVKGVAKITKKGITSTSTLTIQ